MHSVLRSLKQSAKAALGQRESGHDDAVARAAARAAEQARIADTLAHVGDIAYIAPEASAPIEVEVAAESATFTDADAISEVELYSALTVVLDDAMRRSEQLQFPADLHDEIAMPAGWVRVPLVDWLEQRGERSFKHAGGRAMLYRYFNIWEDGSRQEMWSVYVSSGEVPDSRCISLPLALQMVDRFQRPGFMPKNQLIAWRI